MTESDLLLFTFRRCPYAIRSRLALASAGVAYTAIEVDLKSKPAQLLAVSPKGTVPVLVLANGVVLEQSLDIMRWALQQNDPGGLLPSDSAAQRLTDELIECNDAVFKSALDRYKYPGRYGLAEGGAFKDQATEILLQWDALLEQNGCFIDAWPRLADYAMVPFVRQFAGVDPLYFSRLHVPSLQGWLSALTGSALFTRVMAKG